MINEFEKLIRDGWVEIKTDSMASFELAIRRSCFIVSKKSVSENNRFILLGTDDERDRVEMWGGMTYFYNPIMWRVKSLDNEKGKNRMERPKDCPCRGCPKEDCKFFEMDDGQLEVAMYMGEIE